MSHNCPCRFLCTKTVCSFHSAQSGTVVALRRTWALWTRWRGRCGAVIPWRYIVRSKSRAVQTVVQPATDVSTLYKALKCLYVSLAPVLFQSSVLHCVTLDLSPIPRLPYLQPLPAPPPPPPEEKNTTNTSWYEGTNDRFCLSNFQAISFSIQCIEKKKKLHRQESGHKQWYDTEKNKVVGYKILFFFYTLKVTSWDGVERLHRIMFHLQRLWR